jgi:2-polyprenyl-3-methyl-5-hydroxy-6-metoxy-1,4-benzoquinol methylase
MVIKDSDIISKIIFPKSILEEKIKKGSKILDIGCASGIFLNKCDKFGLKTYGLDYSSELLKKAKKVTKAKLYCGSAEDLSVYKSNYFDVLTGFDVIEHLSSPFNFACEAYRVLNPKGKIILTTPNLNSLGRLIMQKKWHGYSDKTHRYLFTPESLAYTLEAVGFKVTKLESPFHPFPKLVQFFTNRLGLGGQIWLVAKK